MIEIASEIGSSGKTNLRVEDRKTGSPGERPVTFRAPVTPFTLLIFFCSRRSPSPALLSSHRRFSRPTHHSLFVAYALGFSGFIAPLSRSPRASLRTEIAILSSESSSLLQAFLPFRGVSLALPCCLESLPFWTETRSRSAGFNDTPLISESSLPRHLRSDTFVFASSMSPRTYHVATHKD
ncbi:hypothetical protein B0H13DRAFT_797698 [Mycena leptocephala]|nr:hypothetical protein B0H13DRAFT_797698 [Mycena leptocephala]